MKFSNVFKDKLKRYKDENLYNRSINKRRIKEEHKHFINTLLSDCNGKHWTAAKIKHELESKFEDVKGISKSTVNRCLKHDLKWSFKKLEKKPAPAFTDLSYMQMLEVSMIQKLMFERDIEIIFIDEFSINTRHHRFYGWAKREFKGYISTQKSDFSMTFICAVSNIKVYGLLGTDSTITSDEVKYYIRQLAEYRNQDLSLANKPFILMYDNAKVHTSDAVVQFIIKSKLRSVGISAYQPVLNPCEKLIGAVKSTLTKLQAEGR